MAKLKTQETEASVEDYIEGLDASKQPDCRHLIALMSDVTGAEARMWGKSLVGFGHYDYTYASGREGTWFLVGFASRARHLTLYIMAGFSAYDDLMARLGKHKNGKSCLHVKNLDVVDVAVLRELVEASVDHMRATYPDKAENN